MAVSKFNLNNFSIPLHDSMQEFVSDATGNEVASTIFTAGGAGVKNVITTVVLVASGGSIRVDFRDGTGGAVFFSLSAATPGSAIFIPPNPIIQPTANTVLSFDSSAATQMYLFVCGFQAVI